MTKRNSKKADKDIIDATRAMDRDPLDTPGLDPLYDAIQEAARANAAWLRAHVASSAS